MNVFFWRLTLDSYLGDWRLAIIEFSTVCTGWYQIRVHNVLILSRLNTQRNGRDGTEEKKSLMPHGNGRTRQTFLGPKTDLPLRKERDSSSRGPAIAFRCVLHRCGSLETSVAESFIHS